MNYVPKNKAKLLTVKREKDYAGKRETQMNTQYNYNGVEYNLQDMIIEWKWKNTLLLIKKIVDGYKYYYY